ncbi:MAG: choice-of-anchor D domain-containing protein [Anaerolineae bacterium]
MRTYSKSVIQRVVVVWSLVATVLSPVMSPANSSQSARAAELAPEGGRTTASSSSIIDEGQPKAPTANVIVQNADDSGSGSLRQALLDAMPGDTITFDGNYTIYLMSTLLISKDVTIDGAGHAVALSGNLGVRVLYVEAGVTTNLRNLTIVDGRAADYGSGIYNSGTLTVANGTFSNDFAPTGGGGIYNAGTLYVLNSTFSGNGVFTPSGGGGAIANDGTATVTSSTFTSNSAGWGGALSTYQSPLTVINSTISGNSSFINFGGGLANWGGTVNVTNSTFSDNSAPGTYGGLANFNGGTLNFANTILANAVAGGDCYNDSMIGTNVNNLVEDGSCSSGGINFLTGDPVLGYLDNNGGQTQTRALLAGSPAMDAGDDTSCTTTDQRGVARPIGAHCDIGAVEEQALAGYWPLDDGSGTIAVDASGHAHDGHLTGGTWSTDHAVTSFSNSGALSLSGASDQGLWMQQPTAATDNISFSAWAKWAGPTGSGQFIFYSGDTGSNGYGFYVYPEGNLSILCGGVNFVNSITPLPLNQWAHVVAVRDHGIWRLYLNGVQLTTTGNPGPYPPNAMAGIGRNPFVNAENFNGLIDDVRIYYRVLTNAEIEQLGRSVAVTPTSLNFGPQLMPDGPTASQPIVISNSTTVNLNITSVTLAGAQPDQFVITSDTGQTLLSPGTTRTIEVVFDPSTAGNLSAELHIVTDQGTFVAALTGTGACVSAITVSNNADDGAGSLRQALLDVCADGTINFNANYTITLVSTLEISRNVTLDGADHRVALSGNNAVRVLYVNPGITLSLDHLTVANGNAGLERGGGLYNDYGTVNVSHSTFIGNVTDSYWGGAIYSLGTVDISNSTFMSNTAGTGGGLFVDNSSATVVNSTFAGNSAGTSAGIFNRSGTLTMNNSIVTNSPTGGNCGGTIDGANNLSNDATCGSGFTNSASILLGALGNHGGNALTISLLPGSAAINTGNDALCPTTDQRGFPRPIGAHCDVGAYEDVGRVGYWPLDDGSGTTAVDASGRNHPGTLTGGTWSEMHAATSDFPNSGALRLTGINGQGLTLARVTTATNNLSLLAWVNWSGTNGAGQMVFYNGSTTANGYGIYLFPDGSLSVFNGNVGYATSTISLTQDVWQQVVAVRESGVWKMYLDGTPITLTGNPVPNTPSTAAAIGRAPTVAANVFNGWIDEVQIYDRALPAIEVSRMSESLSVTPLNIDFGAQSISGGPSADQIISVTNIGGVAVHLNSVSLFGADPDLFSVVADSGQTTLAAGETRTLSVIFAPITVGAKSATLRIVTNNNTFDAGLSGTGTGFSELAVSPASLNFGSQSISAGATASQIISVTNTGTLDLTGISVGLTGTDADQFTITSDTAEPWLTPTAVRTVHIAFDPSTVGAKSATLHVVTDAGTRDVVLNGTGTGYSEITIAPSSLSFGSQSISAGATADQSVFITSTGNLPLTGISVSLIGTNYGEFAVTADTAETTLAPGAVRTVTVAFDPTTVSAKTAILRIASDSGTRDIALSGTSTGYSQLTVSPLSLSFGNQLLSAGQTAAQTINITNTGNITLTISGVIVTGTDSLQFIKTSDSGQTTLGPGANRTVQIAFDPSTLGAKTASLSITTDNGSGSVTLSGTGTGVSQLSVSPTSLSFGSRLVPGGPTAEQAVNISNSGDANLSVTSVTLTGADSSQFIVKSDTAQSTVAPGATRLVKITFDPSTVGAKTAALHIITDNGTQDVALSGTGLGVSELVVSPGSLAYSAQRFSAGPTFAYSVYISNTGTANLNVTSVSLTGATPGEYVVTSDSGQTTLIPNAARIVKVAFDPTSIGPKTANLTIVTDNGTRDVALTGSGLSGLVAYLNFDEANGATSFADSSGSGHGATCTDPNCPTAGLMAGYTGTSLRFGSLQTVNIANHADLNSPRFSISAWVHPTGFDAVDTPQTVIAKQTSGGANRTYNLTIYPNPLAKTEAGVRFSFTAKDCTTLRSFDSTDTILLNDWSQLTLTYDGGYLKLYINGQLDRSEYVNDGVCLNTAPVTIGNGTGGYKGMLDEVRLYDYALAASEVTTLNAQSPIPMKCSKDTLTLVQYEAKIPFSSNTRIEALVEVYTPTLTNVSSSGCDVSGQLRIFTYGNDLRNIAVAGHVDQDNNFTSRSFGTFKLDLAGFTLRDGTATLTVKDGSPRLTIYNSNLQAPQKVGGLSVPLFKPIVIDNESGLIVDGTIGLPSVSFGAYDAAGGAADKMDLKLSALAGGFVVQNGRLIIKANGSLGLPFKVGKSNDCGINASIEFYVDLSGTAMMRVDAPAPITVPKPDAAVWPVGLSDLTFGMSCKPGIPIPIDGGAAGNPIWLTGIRGTFAASQEDSHFGAGVTLATSSYTVGPLAALTVSGDMKFGIKPMSIYPGSIPEVYEEVSGEIILLDLWKAASGSLSINSVEGVKATAQFRLNLLVTNLTMHLWSSNPQSVPSLQSIHMTGSGQLALGVNKGEIANICGIPYPCNCYWHWKSVKILWWWVDVPYYWCDNLCTDCLAIPTRNLWLYGVGVEFGDFRRGTNTMIGFKGYTDSTVREIQKLINLPDWAKPIFNALHVGFFFDAKNRTLTFVDWEKYKLIDAKMAQKAKQLSILSNARPLTAAEQALVHDVKFVNDKTVLLNASNQVSQGKANNRPVGPNDAITRTQVFTQTDTLFNITADQPFEMSLISPAGQEITPLNYNQPPVSPTLKIGYSTIVTYTLPRPISSAPRWRFINTSFDDARQGLQVQLDSTLVLTEVNVLDTTAGYTETVAGEHAIDIILAGQSKPVVTLPISAELDRAYSVIVVGSDLADTLIVTDTNDMPAAFGQSHLRLVNGAAQAPAAFDVSVDGEAWINSSTFKAVSDYRVLASGTHTVEVRSALDQTLFATRTLNLNEGGIYTLLASDWLSTTQYMLNLSNVLDEQYRVSTITQYAVAQAPIGEWQVQLIGNLDTANWAMGVLGQPNGPVMSGVTLDATKLDTARVSLNLKSEINPVKITYKLKSDKLTETTIFTLTDEVTTTAVVPQLNGRTLAEVTISDTALLNGTQPIVQDLNLDGLASGNYYILIVVEDGVNPSAEAFARPPAGYSLRGQRVLNRPELPAAAQTSRVSDPMDLLLGVEPLPIDNAATFPGHFASTPITLSLNANVYQDISGTQALVDKAPLYIQWSLSNNPDTDNYVVYIDTQPFPADGVLTTTHLITTEHLLDATTGAHIWREVFPGQTYYVAIGAIDYATGQIDRSPMVSIAVTSGDFGLLNPIAPVQLIDSITTTVDLTKTADLFFAVSGAPDQTALPVGLSAQSDEAINDQLPITLTASLDIAPGLYTVPIIGYSGELSRTVDLQVQVERPDLVITKALLTPSAKTGETVSYRIAFTNTGTVAARGVIITDTVFANMTGLTWNGSVNVHSADGQVWTVDDLAPNATGYINVSGVMPASSVGGVLPSDVQITTSTPEYAHANNAASVYLALDGQPIVSTIGPFEIGEPVALGDGLCGSVTFASADELPATLTITYTERQPSVSQTGLQRQYRIVPEGGSNYLAQLTLCYDDAELSLAHVNDEADLHAYRYEGSGVWQQFSTIDALNNTVTAEGVTQFGVWGLGSASDIPTAVVVADLQARSAGSNLSQLALACALIVLGLSVIIGWRRNRH